PSCSAPRRTRRSRAPSCSARRRTKRSRATSSPTRPPSARPRRKRIREPRERVLSHGLQRTCASEPEDRVTYRLGVDLGTTFTAAAVTTDRGVDVLSLGNRALQVPSVVYVMPDGSI